VPGTLPQCFVIERAFEHFAPAPKPKIRVLAVDDQLAGSIRSCCPNNAGVTPLPCWRIGQTFKTRRAKDTDTKDGAGRK